MTADDPSSGYPTKGGPFPAQSTIAREVMVGLCRTILASDQCIDLEIRRARLNRLDFDMLLDLYIAEHDGQSRCLWDVCQAAIGPFSSAHRRLSVLIKNGFVLRLGA